jgi:hypothetical protein
MRSTWQQALLLFVFLTAGSAGHAQDAVTVPPAHPATVEQVRKLLSLSHATERVVATISGQIEIRKKQGPNIFPDAFWSDFQVEFAKTDWVSIAVPVYQRYFSEEEANAVIAFYSTPVGQKVLDSSQALTQELSSQGYGIGKEIGARLGEKYKTEIEENMKKLQQGKTSGTPSPQN